MNVVVDASALVAALVDAGPEGQWAESVLAAGDLFAPYLLLVETTNILRRLELARQIAPVAATAARRELTELNVAFFDFEPFSDRIWELRRNLTSYDAWYVATAEALGLPLATLDRRLAKARGVRCRFLLPEARLGLKRDSTKSAGPRSRP